MFVIVQKSKVSISISKKQYLNNKLKGYVVDINGRIVGYASTSKSKIYKYELDVNSNFRKVKDYKLSKLFETFSEISFDVLNDSFHGVHGLSLSLILEPDDARNMISFFKFSYNPVIIDLDSTHIKQYFKVLNKIWNNLNPSNPIYNYESSKNYLAFDLGLQHNNNFTPQEYFKNLGSNILRIHLKVKSILKTNTKNIFFTSKFNFPREIKTACEQYLTYFSQFLRDMGIESNTEIKSNAHEVLFTVKPEDPNQALEQVYEALKVYLSLPDYPDIQNDFNLPNNYAVIELKRKVNDLKGNLMLAKQMMLLQQNNIDQLQEKNYKLANKIISIGAKAPYETKILWDTVTIKEYENSVVKIDVPKILKGLKRAFIADSEEKKSDVTPPLLEEGME